MHHSRTARLSFAAIVLAAATIAVAAPADAETPTCDGRPATIVGPGPDNVVEGTPGDDVVVTTAEVANGPDGAVNTYGGDDIVCIIPGSAPIPYWEGFSGFTVDTGPGDDKVINHEPRNASDLVVRLGLGADRFVGNDRIESVWAGQPRLYPDGPWWNMPDDAQDTIDTAGGQDRIYTGTPGAVNTDIISSGLGRDEITVAGTGATIDNGGVPGEGDRLNFLGHGWKQSLFTIDNRSRTATGDTGEVLRWTNVDVFHVVAESPLRYIGADTRDMVYLDSSLHPYDRTAVPVDVSLNGGDDYVSFSGGIAPGRVDGGDGIDTFASEYSEACLDVTAVLDESYTCVAFRAVIPGVPTHPGPAPTYQVALDGLETYLSFYAKRSLTVIGTERPDEIVARAPHTLVKGLGGRDRILADHYNFYDTSARSVVRGGTGADQLTGGRGKETLIGNRGADRLRGKDGNDRLKGGTGKDSARGGAGSDRCTTEIRKGCEER